MPEPTEERFLLQETGHDLALLLYGLMRSVTLYEPNNATIAKQIELLMDRLTRGFAELNEGVRLQLLADELFVNGKLLRMDPRFWDRAVALASALREYGIGEISFDQGLAPTHLQAFVNDLSASARAKESRLSPDGYGPLQVGEAQGRSLASMDFRPDRFALLLSGSLLEVMEWLYAQRDREGLSLLPLRRTLQLVIDAAHKDPAIFQIIAAVRDPIRPPGWSRLRLAATVDAICFGHYLTLHRREIMVLAVAAVLSGLSESPDPAEAVRPLFRLRGIRDAAMAMALAVHDARACLLGQRGGMAGQMLATCEAYHDLCSASETRPALPPAQALQQLLRGAVPGLDRGVVQTFAEYKGPFPLGSSVALSNGSPAIVVGQGEGLAGKHRPIVMYFDGVGLYGNPLDLSEEAEVWIDPGAAQGSAVNLART